MGLAYTIVLYSHIFFVGLYLVHLLVRLSLLWFAEQERLLLFQDRSKAANILVLFLTMITGLYLGFTYDFSEGLWFVIKLFLLGLTVFIGDYAFKTFNKLAGLLVLLIFLYIIGISYTKSLLLITT